MVLHLNETELNGLVGNGAQLNLDDWMQQDSVQEALKAEQRSANAKRADSFGQRTEAAVDRSLNLYKSQGLLAWWATGPKTRTERKPAHNSFGKKWRTETHIIGAGPPDRTITLKGGISCLMEIKHFLKGKGHKSIKRVHQWEALQENVALGGCGGYLIWWNEHKKWMWHPASVTNLAIGTKEPKVKLIYDDAIEVQFEAFQFSFDGNDDDPMDNPDIALPDPLFLDIIREYA